MLTDLKGLPCAIYTALPRVSHLLLLCEIGQFPQFYRVIIQVCNTSFSCNIIIKYFLFSEKETAIEISALEMPVPNQLHPTTCATRDL